MIEGYRRCCGMDIHKDTVVVCVLPRWELRREHPQDFWHLPE